ncbi:importin beta-like SAD2, partial [Tanacetum coccineum]
VGPLPLILKPQVHNDTYLLKLCCDNDQKLWEEDPYEYVRKGYDLDCNNGLCHRVDEKEGKRKSSEIYIVHCGNFQEDGVLLAKEAPVEIKPYRQKDGALLAIGTLVQQSECRIVFRWELHSIMILFECYAAWVAGQYAHINFSDPNNFRKALPSVVAGMRNPELSVRVDSVFALRSFVKAFKDLGFLTFLLTLNQLYFRSCAGCLRLMVKTARIFNTYGPRMCLDDGRVVSNFVSQVDGLMALMEGGHIRPFNLGNPGEFTICIPRTKILLT